MISLWQTQNQNSHSLPLPAELVGSIHLSSNHHSDRILSSKHIGIADARAKLDHSLVRWKIIAQGKEWSSSLGAGPSLPREIPCSQAVHPQNRRRLNRGGFCSHSVTKAARFGSSWHALEGMHCRAEHFPPAVSQPCCQGPRNEEQSWAELPDPLPSPAGQGWSCL